MFYAWGLKVFSNKSELEVKDKIVPNGSISKHENHKKKPTTICAHKLWDKSMAIIAIGRMNFWEK